MIVDVRRKTEAIFSLALWEREKVRVPIDNPHPGLLPKSLSQSRKMHNCHSEQSEESNVSCHLLKRDPSAIASGLHCDTSSQGEKEQDGSHAASQC